MASAKYVVTPPPYSEGSGPGVYFEKDKVSRQHGVINL